MDGSIKLKNGETVFSTKRVSNTEKIYSTEDLMSGNVAYRLDPDSLAFQNGEVEYCGEKRAQKLTELQFFFPTELIAHQAHDIYKDEKYLQAHGNELSAAERDNCINALCRIYRA